jgi:hypothetical protein
LKTLLLDRDKWDLVLDASGNIALADNPYAVAQNVSSACRTFAGECWYNTAIGVPYWDILGQLPPRQFVKSALENEALRVPEVGMVEFEDLQVVNRQLIDLGVSFK